MRAITITYAFSGDETVWQNAVDAFISALDADQELDGRFSYQVAVADDKVTRIHWGRWDSAETLAHVQSQPYFKEFAGKVREFAGGAPNATGHDIVTKTGNW
ncbi:hypothetical protein [Falsiruegeria mediterranea]|uniref:ABM domain-containing protein n=1 Tax=Falsiruegeria mediterranea M17 TaxID=1200281 RepID=A0A2R8CC97_9RHOB|nr:hypothetical protein [Falsiruegeria mediterranea]SPJ30094.1 hypothetical protein TRM7615_03622 [Falsiruegeria mediterranea M17]